MGTLIAIGCLLWAVISFAKATENRNLKKENPEAWIRLQEMEHERKKMRNQALSNGAGLACTIAKVMLKK
jgi:hypothetical protein